MIAAPVMISKTPTKAANRRRDVTMVSPALRARLTAAHAMPPVHIIYEKFGDRLAIDCEPHDK